LKICAAAGESLSAMRTLGVMGLSFDICFLPSS
jgi:hypothetical protein